MTEYTWITEDLTWSQYEITEADHEACCRRAEDYLSEHEGDDLSISVRRIRDGEAAGIYQEMSSGDLQILGYSIPTPDHVRDLTDQAWEHALQTWPDI